MTPANFVPKPLLFQFNEFMKQQSNTVLLAMTMRRSMASFVKSVDVIKAYQELQEAAANEIEPLDPRKVGMFKSQVEFAQAEIDAKYPFLYSMSAVALWASLETYIADLVILLLEHDPELLNSKEVRKIKVTLADFERYGPEDRRRFIVDTLKNDLGLPGRKGADRFEELLKVFTLSGEVRKDIKDSLFELSQVRNALVHRQGRADAKLISACPWLELEPGEKIVIEHDKLKGYSRFTQLYGIAVFKRVMKHFGRDTTRLDELEVVFDEHPDVDPSQAAAEDV